MTSAPERRSRLADARRTTLAALASLLPAVLIHDLISFGLIRPLIRWSDVGCITGDSCVGIAVVLMGYVLLALPLTVIFALLGAVLLRLRFGTYLLALIWLVACGWSLATIASGYRVAFGATWLWHEPFVELMAHSYITPLTVCGGLLGFVSLLRHA